MITTDSLEIHRAELMEELTLWRFLHDLFRYPDAGTWVWLHEPRVAEAWQRMQQLVPDGESPAGLPATYHAYEEEYLAAFEVGMPYPRCPLIESHWNKRDPVPKVLHENILFYKRFGLQLRASANETADHLRHQLEFLAHLCALELDALNADDAENHAEQAAHARLDYLERHTGYWVPRATAFLRQEAPDSWPAAWMNVLEGACAWAMEALRSRRK